MKREKIIIISAAGLVALLIILAVFGNLITIPQSVSTYLEVYPQKKWVLLHNPQGQLISKVTDHELGRITDYRLIQFDRGEEVQLLFDQSVHTKQKIEEGELVLRAGSSLIEERIAQLEGEINVNKAEIELVSTGEKEAAIAEAKNQLDFAEARLNEKKIIYDRSKQLFEKDLTSKALYEFDEWQYKFADFEKRIAKSTMETLTTGAKPEQLDYIKSKINSLSNELSLLKNRNSNLTITSPISGWINFNHSSIDTLLSVSSLDKVILNVPVRMVDYYKYKPNDEISIYFPTLGITLKGKLLRVSNEVKVLMGRQIVYASIQVPNIKNNLIPGMILESSVGVGSITLLDYLKEFFVN